MIFKKRLKIYICAENGAEAAPYARILKRAVKTALSEQGVNVPCEINVLLTDDDGIKEKNRLFRGVDKPTDVLSFPLQEFKAGVFSASGADIDLDTGRIPLGDIVISCTRAICQAEEFGHSAEREIAYLTVHSVLHLLGYDHMDEGEEKKEMRRREEIIMEKMGLKR